MMQADFAPSIGDGLGGRTPIQRPGITRYSVLRSGSLPVAYLAIGLLCRICSLVKNRGREFPRSASDLAGQIKVRRWQDSAWGGF